jgi:hypothetical protein
LFAKSRHIFDRRRAVVGVDQTLIELYAEAGVNRRDAINVCAISVTVLSMFTSVQSFSVASPLLSGCQYHHAPHCEQMHLCVCAGRDAPLTLALFCEYAPGRTRGRR